MLRHSHRRPGPRLVNRRLLLQRSLSLLTGSAAVMLACGKKQEARAPSGAVQSTAQSGATAAQPKRGGRFMDLVITEVGNLNPVTTWGQGQYIVGAYVYDRLVNSRLDKDTAKEYIPEAAQSVEMPEPTTVIFKLKPGMKFQNRPPVNGRAVTPEDVVKSQLYVRDNPAAQDRSFQTASMQSVEAPDAQTVVFKLKAPNAYLFSATQLTYPQSTCIIPRELLDNLDTAWPVGSGPYEVVEYELQTRYLLRRFEGYRDATRGLPYIDEREVRLITDPAAQEATFRSEQGHVWNVPLPRLADQVKRDLGERIVMHEYIALAPVPLAMNATRPPFKDVRVREAVYRFLDRKQFLDLLDEGRGAVPPGLLSVGLSEYQLDSKQTEKYWRQDLRAARQLLEAAGFDFNRELSILTLNRPRNNQGGEIFQQQASRVGMKVRLLAPVPLNEWHHRMQTGDWDLFYAAMPGYDSPQKVLRFQHSNSQSAYLYTGPKDPEIDRMIEKSEVTLDRNERVKLVKDIQIALLERYTPFLLTHNYTAYVALWKYVRDYEVNPASHAMPRVEMWLDR